MVFLYRSKQQKKKNWLLCFVVQRKKPNQNLSEQKTASIDWSILDSFYKCVGNTVSESAISCAQREWRANRTRTSRTGYIRSPTNFRRLLVRSWALVNNVKRSIFGVTTGKSRNTKSQYTRYLSANYLIRFFFEFRFLFA